MKSISVGELRQNPTRMLDDVAAGETYLVTRHNREIARIVPTRSSASIVSPVADGPADAASLPRVDLPEGMSVDDLLDDLKGDW